MKRVATFWFLDPETNKKFEALFVRVYGQISWLAPLWVKTPPNQWIKIALA